MDFEAGLNSRVSFDRSLDGLRIRIKAPRNMFAMLFLPIWWAGWTGGIIAVTRQLLTGGDAFLLIWLAFATVGWLLVPVMWLWMLAGYEEVLVNRRTLTFDLGLQKWRISQTVPLDKVNDLRAAGYFPNTRYGVPWKSSYWSWLLRGSVALNRGKEVIRFGSYLDEPGAREIVARIQPYLSAEP